MLVEEGEEEEKENALVSVPYSQKYKVIDKLFSYNVVLQCVSISFQAGRTGGICQAPSIHRGQFYPCVRGDPFVLSCHRSKLYNILILEIR